MNKRNFIIGGGVLALLFIFMMVPKKKQVPVEAMALSAPKPKVSVTAKDLHQQALTLKEEGDMEAAKQVYQRIFNEYPDAEAIETVQQELGDLNLEIIFSNTPTENSVMHQVVSGDTLGELAKKYGTTIELIKISNHLKNNIIRIGQQLRVWTGAFNIFVDKSQNILILKSGDEVLKVYQISTGKHNSTPIGEFKVTSRLEDPVWFNRGVVVPPESPHNVLGSRWLGFDIPGYGIHGTIEPETIGQQVTAGCVRMRNEEVEELYSIIPMGTRVVVVD